MTKLSFGAHPHLLGFEQLERLVERTAKSGAEGYPPFNIEAVAENAYRISLAVAGFHEDDLSITIEDRQLVIRGRQADDLGDRVFLLAPNPGRLLEIIKVPRPQGPPEQYRRKPEFINFCQGLLRRLEEESPTATQVKV